MFEPRSATSRRAVFQHDYAEAFTAADEILIGPVHQADKAPVGDRFDPERLASDLRGRGAAARHLADPDKIVEWAQQAYDGTAAIMREIGVRG